MAGDDPRWGYQLDSSKMTPYQLRRWRAMIAPHLRWWGRIVAAMQRKRWRRVDELNWQSGAVLKALQEIDHTLERLERAREDEAKSPPY